MQITTALIMHIGDQALYERLANPQWAYTVLANSKINLRQFSDYYYHRFGVAVHAELRDR